MVAAPYPRTRVCVDIERPVLETEQRVRANGQRVAPLCSLLSLGRKILCVVTNGDVDVDVVCGSRIREWLGSVVRGLLRGVCGCRFHAES